MEETSTSKNYTKLYLAITAVVVIFGLLTGGYIIMNKKGIEQKGEKHDEKKGKKEIKLTYTFDEAVADDLLDGIGSPDQALKMLVDKSYVRYLSEDMPDARFIPDRSNTYFYLKEFCKKKFKYTEFPTDVDGKTCVVYRDLNLIFVEGCMFRSMEDILNKCKNCAIVNATNEECESGEGVNKRINALYDDKRANRRQLSLTKLLETKFPVLAGRNRVRCPTGANITTVGHPDPMNGQGKGCHKFILHVVGPDCRCKVMGQKRHNKALLMAYFNALFTAWHLLKVDFVLMPLISRGIYRFPPKEHARILRKAIEMFNKLQEEWSYKIAIVVFVKGKKPGALAKYLKDFNEAVDLMTEDEDSDYDEESA